jgi:hypothetical protein
MNTRDNETENQGSAGAHESYEHQDLQVSGIVYFIVSLVLVTIVCMFGLAGFYHYLDRRDRATQEPVNPLVKKVPEDTRAVTSAYPQTAFPNPRLEVDERNQLNGFLTKQDDTLYSYGWVDQKAGIVRIPIERAMDLLVQRGLPVLPQGANQSPAAAAKDNQRANTAQGVKGAKGAKQ